MKIDIYIDKITNCLLCSASNEEVETYYKKRIEKYSRTKNDWLFDWREPQKQKYEIYELFTEDDELQGRIAFADVQYGVFVYLVESAYHNRVAHKYQGVGAHLFAIACKRSFDNGFDGYVAFDSKTSKIEHYKKVLGAKLISSQRMVIEPKEACDLLNKYFPDKIDKERY